MVRTSISIYACGPCQRY